MSIESNFSFASTPERENKWENEPVEVVNVLERMSIESLQKIKGDGLTPKNAVDIDSRALLSPDCPNIVFGRPHGGEYVPKELWENASEDGRLTFGMIDRGTDAVFRSQKIPSVGTKMSRWIVDPNRPPLPGQKVEGSKAPGEVLWKNSLMHTPAYQPGKTPDDETIIDFSERFYLPYYNGMMNTIGSLTDRRGKSERVLVIDGHSFMVSTNDFFDPICGHYQIKELKKLPLFIIGDRDGTTCDKDIRNAFAKSLEENFKMLNSSIRESLLKHSSSQRIIGLNEFMKGVRNVQFYGQRQEGVSGLQLELNEGMFVDEEDEDYLKAKYNFSNLEIARKLIEKTCLEIDAILKK